MVTHTGGCHCGAVAFEFDAEASPLILRCNCSICEMSGIDQIIIPRRSFRLLRGENTLSTYTFGTGIAQHLFCPVCGIKPFYIPRSNPDGVAINFNCCDKRTFGETSVTDFDGRHWEDHAHTLSDLSR